jgi:DNA-binding NarL/FixJ family response regulator
VIRVLIADDHPLVRSGLRALLSSIEGIQLVGEAADGSTAVELALREHPDVVVMDIQMPGLGGIEATRQLAARAPGAAVLMLTMHEDDESVFAAMRAGARGYLLKGAEQEEVVGAIQAVSRGEAIFGPGVAQRVLRLFGTGKSAEPFPELTSREREVLDLMASGASNLEIARRLFLSPKTVSNNVSSILGKLQVAERAKAIVRARRAGLGGNGDHAARSDRGGGDLPNGV